MDKFVIYKSLDNVFTLTIKQQGSTLPMPLDYNGNADSFKVSIRTLDTSDEVLTTEGASPSIVVTKDDDLTTGKIHIAIDKDSLTELSVIGNKGGKVDRYYLKPLYSMLIECDTGFNGKFVARINEVYVDA